MPYSPSRRQLAAGLATLGFAATFRNASAAESCALPEWVAPLRADLEAMAKRLTVTLKPWNGPKRIVTP